MSLVAEFRTGLTQLRAALRAVPDTTVTHEQSCVSCDGEVKWYVWAHGDDVEAFKGALEDDPSVGRFAVLAAQADRSLFRLTLDGPPEAFPLAVVHEFDVLVLDVRHSSDGTFVRARCPSRTALVRLKGVVEDEYGEFVTLRLHREAASNGEVYDVTPAQQEALLHALEVGYFAVPRSTTLGAMADEMEISDQALSSRLRRGTAALVRDTLAEESDLNR